MSTISITFTAIGDNATNGGYVELGVLINGVSSTLRLTSKDGPSVVGYFAAIPLGIPTDEDDAQAQAFLYAWNRDYKNVGGTGNLNATQVDNVITITAIVGTFETFAETGNFAVNSGITNTAQTTPLVLTVTRSASTGDCTNIQYAATTTGGVSTYTLNDGLSNIATSWDGSSFNFNLARGKVAKVTVTDSNSNTKNTVFMVPRILAAGDFSISLIQYETYSDVTVNRDIVIAGLTPLQYSLDETTETTGQNYQTSNGFAGVLAGTYKLFVKDVYGCEIVKTITVTSLQDSTVNETPRYFDIAEGQSFLFFQYREFDSFTKRNYFNTGSYNEMSDVRYKVKQGFVDGDDLLATQFKSSYEWHNITLNLCEGTQIDVPPVLIQENLGAKEKMDCTIFPIEGQTGKMGVYFQGGNTYTPDTTDVLGTSTYNGTTPRWAVVGQLVFIDSYGGLTIESTGYDSVRGGYFVVNAVVASEISSKIQVTYNKQDYNLYEFFVDIRDIVTEAFVVIEKGFEGLGSDGDPWISEIIENITDDNDRLLIEWKDSKNKGGIVFQSGITYRIRPYGEFLLESEEESEVYDGDSQVVSLQQKSQIGFELLFEGITFRQCMQLNVASGLETFVVNGLKLVRKKPPEKRRLGQSNLWTWRCSFGYGANLLGIQSDETVLSPTTGVVGGGGTGKDSVIDLTGTTLIQLSDGRYVKINGNLVNL